MIGILVRETAFELGRRAGLADLVSGRRSPCPWSSSDPSWIKQRCARAFWSGYNETRPLEVDMTGVPEPLPDDGLGPTFTDWRSYLRSA